MGNYICLPINKIFKKINNYLIFKKKKNSRKSTKKKKAKKKKCQAFPRKIQKKKQIIEPFLLEIPIEGKPHNQQKFATW